MKIDGSCHCGNITYEAEVNPDRAFICNCTDCQMLSGSTFRSIVPSREDAFKLLSGEMKTYVKTGDSGNRRTQTFCPDCGSPIYSTTDDDGPKVYGIRLGTVRQRDQIIPKLRLWARSAQPWLGEIEAMPARDQQ